MTTTTQALNLYKADVLKWFIAKRDYPYLEHPEPEPINYNLSSWTANKVKEEVRKDVERKV